jgi:hypothetical protein
MPRPSPTTLSAASRVLATAGERTLAVGIALFVLIPAALAFMALEFVWIGIGLPKIPSPFTQPTPTRGTFWENQSHRDTTFPAPIRMTHRNRTPQPARPLRRVPIHGRGHVPTAKKCGLFETP